MRTQHYTRGDRSATPYHVHSPLDIASLTRLFGEWLQATNDDRCSDGAGLLRQMEEGGICRLHVRRKDAHNARQNGGSNA
jgi:hypothetical protein